MVDVAKPVGSVEQIRLIAGLRWRILRNNLRKKNNQLDLLGLIFAGFGAAVLVFGLCFAFFVGTDAILSGSHPEFISLLFWGIFLFWQAFPIFMAGFSSGFVFRTLLRFPFHRSTFYVISLAYGLADFSAVASICWLTSITLAAAFVNIRFFLPMVFVVSVFALMNVTLERLIGSWLERLLARRRTRELLFGLFILSSISIQFIVRLLEKTRLEAHPWIAKIAPFFSFLPPTLAGRTVISWSESHFSLALICLAGLVLYLLVFSVLPWNRLSTQYRGEELSESVAPALSKSKEKFRAEIRSGAENQGHRDTAPPILSPIILGVIKKEFRYLTRNGMSFLSILMPPVLVFFFSASFAGTNSMARGQGISPDIFFPGMIAYLMFLFLGPAYNSFAYDGRGIQLLFSAPVRFREILLGKNLFLVSYLLIEMAVCLAVLFYRVGIPSFPVQISVFAAVLFILGAQLTLGNWSSLTFPLKLDFGQMRGQRNSGISAWIMFGSQIVLAGSSALILAVGHWLKRPWLPSEIFLFLTIAAFAGYFSSLHALSDLAEKNKETLMEALCR